MTSFLFLIESLEKWKTIQVFIGYAKKEYSDLRDWGSIRKSIQNSPVQKITQPKQMKFGEKIYSF